ncbi:MAG: HlyD family efflux transporter periplasmic adaptor subunit [Desulfobacterales bacterium]|nr:HlyD family efflux transporter periplasmic adaptor subunit [Desulfobacterales bacterium]MDX2513396.1 HlyD family efflux transporter periplasmic adaptor subunit [Desulfobacterales bacterium]
MESKQSKKAPVRTKQIVTRVILCLIILLFGLLIMNKLSALKKPPAEAKRTEHALQVQGTIVKTEDVRVFLSGYGEIKTLNTVTISPEISGRVVNVHPRLESGEIIPRGATLFEIDSRIYAATLQEANASLQQLKNSVLRLEKQFALDRERQKTIKRNQELAELEFKRIQQLYEVNEVGTRSGVDRTEQTYNAAVDQTDQMARALALYPLQIQEVNSGIEAAKARYAIAEVNLHRCRVTSPFTGRIKMASIETGQFVTPGQALVTLADDTLLEIQVSLAAEDARQWLLFDHNPSENNATWFSKLTPVKCRLRWTENPETDHRTGVLDRVVQFNPQTRTLTVAIRIDAENTQMDELSPFPLVEGMFCMVDIPGKILQNVVRLPPWSVSFENMVYLATDESRLKTVPVTVIYTEGENVFVSEGLTPGQTVVTTRLSDPLENALLAVTIKPLPGVTLTD